MCVSRACVGLAEDRSSYLLACLALREHLAALLQYVYDVSPEFVVSSEVLNRRSCANRRDERASRYLKESRQRACVGVAYHGRYRTGEPTSGDE
jgi:hypothetical protein